MDEKLLHQLRPLAEEFFRDHEDLLRGESYEEQLLNRTQKLEAASKLKASFRFGESLYVSGWPAQSQYARRLACHAYWRAWNVVLDPPKAIDAELSKWTMELRMALLQKERPIVPACICIGLRRLEDLGVPPKPLSAVVPGKRAKGQ